jgi:hypothetical protein
MPGIALQLDITGNALPAAELLTKVPQSNGMKLAMGRGAGNQLKRHFIGLNEARHRTTVPGRGYFRRVADSVQSPVATRDGVTIAITEVGVRQRLLGGRIEAEPGHMLTIPARTEALGRRASSFDDLRILYGRGGRPVALVQRDADEISFRKATKTKAARIIQGRSIGGGVFYWLKDFVDQPPDPSVLPPPGALENAAIDGGRQWLLAQVQKQ